MDSRTNPDCGRDFAVPPCRVNDFAYKHTLTTAGPRPSGIKVVVVCRVDTVKPTFTQRVRRVVLPYATGSTGRS
jgi:hypothetical protein